MKKNKQFKTCQVTKTCFNEEKIKKLRSELSNPKDLSSQAEKYKAMGHPLRLAILQILTKTECCVCDIANILEIPVSTASQHLKTLRYAGLLNFRQEGKWVYYYLDSFSLTQDLLRSQTIQSKEGIS